MITETLAAIVAAFSPGQEMAHEPLRITQDTTQLECGDLPTQHRALRAAKRMGFNTVRVQTKPWERCNVDRSIGLINEYGLEPYVTLTSITLPEMRVFVRKHADNVEWWSVWNEPNHPRFSSGDVTADPKTYIKFYGGAYKIIHANDDQARVLFGEFANDHSKSLRIMAGHLSKRGLKTEGVAIHPYVAEPNASYNIRFKADVKAYRTRVRRMADHGSLNTPTGGVPPIYATEFGIIRTNEWAGNAMYAEADVSRAITSSWRIADSMGLKGMCQYKLNEDLTLESGGFNTRESSILTSTYQPTMRSRALRKEIRKYGTRTDQAG